MSWINLPATAATDWTDAAFINQFRLAIEERLKVWERNLFTGAQYSTTWAEEIVDGDYVGHCGQFTEDIPWRMPPSVFIQTQEHRVWSWRVAQYQVEQMFQWAVRKEHGDVVGLETGTPGWSAGQSYWTYRGNEAQFWTDAGITGGGWTRKFPRTIASSSSSGSNGQRAYLGTQDSATTRLSDGATNEIYQHDGTEWLLSDDQLTSVDTLEDTGQMEPGDYIGPWVFNELYLALKNIPNMWINVFTSTESPTVTGGSKTKGGFAEGTHPADTPSDLYDDAEDDLLNNFAINSCTHPSGLCVGNTGQNELFATSDYLYYTIIPTQSDIGVYLRSTYETLVRFQMQRGVAVAVLRLSQSSTSEGTLTGGTVIESTSTPLVLDRLLPDDVLTDVDLTNDLTMPNVIADQGYTYSQILGFDNFGIVHRFGYIFFLMVLGKQPGGFTYT